MKSQLEYVDTVTIPGEIWTINSHRIIGIHYRKACRGRRCVIHSPSTHHMSKWPMLYRNDRNIFERICEHGIGHPDPDQFQYWRVMGTEFEAVHGCDGCCSDSAVGSTVPGPTEPTCDEPGCDSLLSGIDDGSDYCESHRRDEYGVMDMDCDCSVGTADNMDVLVCIKHELAYRKKFEKDYLNKWETT